MSASSTVPLLRAILTGLLRSMPQYVAECSPWTHRGDADADGVIQGIIDDQQRRAAQVAEAIVERGGLLAYPAFPDWTRLNYAALDYLLEQLVAYQSAAAARFEALRDQLPKGGKERALADSVAADAQRHLSRLRELAAKHQYSQQVSVVTEGSATPTAGPSAR